MIQISEQTPLLPLQEAVRQLTGKTFHRYTVHRWRKAGKLKCFRVGNQWMTTAKEVEAMIERDSLQPTGEQAEETALK